MSCSSRASKSSGESRKRLNEAKHDATKKLRLTNAATDAPADTDAAAAAVDSYFFANLDVAAIVFSFLDIKSLLRLSLTNKTCLGLLQYEHVVRSALMQGGHAKKSMERLVRLIEQRCIWTPSPPRMLRLVNGKRCERCNRGRVNLVSESFGVLFCFDGCIKYRYTKNVARNNKWRPYLDHPRVAKAEYSSMAFLWTDPYTDTAGDRCGPLISKSEIDRRIMPKEVTIPEILQEKDAEDKHANGVPEILKSFRETTDAAEKRREEIAFKKRQASKDANEKRKTKILNMIEMLSNELGEVPWKEVALSCRWVEIGPEQRDLIFFRVAFVRECLEDFVRAPSKASKKKIQEKAKILKENFELLEEKHLLDFSFLSQSDPAEKALNEFCREHYPEYRLIQDPFQMNSNTLRDIRSGIKTPMDVLRILMGNDFEKALAPAGVAASMVDIQESMREKATSLFRLLWKRERSIQRRLTVPACFSACVEKFPRLYQNTLDFLEATVSGAVAWEPSHRYLLSEIWSGHPQVVEPLLSRDYEAVVKIILRWR